MRLRFLTLSLLLPCALHGCAVLTVDVDVYKGPLSNHEAVQMEQLAVMAIGARPLLVKLRNQLEDDYRKKARGADCMCPTKGKLLCYADEPYVKDPDCLTCPDARTVNAILGLYLDQARTTLGKLVAEGREIVAETERVIAELDDFSADAELWKRVSARANHTESCRRSPGSAAGCGACAIKSVLHKDATTGYRLVEPLGKLLARTSELPNPSTATLRFARLRRASELAQVVSDVLPNARDQDLREELLRRILRIGELFLRGRELVARGLSVVLEIITVLESAPEEIHNREAWLRKAAAFAAHLVDLDALNRAINHSPPAASLLHWNPGGTQSQSTLNREQLVSLLSGETETLSRMRVASDLRLTHTAVQSKAREARETQDKQVADEFGNFDHLRFGIARGLNLSEQDGIAIKSFLSQFEAMAAMARDFGFDRGRLEDGLEMLIENYLRASDALGPKTEPSVDVQVSRRRLATGLTHFAEKVLILVNNDTVLSGSPAGGEREAYVMLLESIGNSILTLNDELHHQWERSYEDGVRAPRLLATSATAWRTDPKTVIDDLLRTVRGDAVIPSTLLADQREATAEREKKEAELSEARTAREAAAAAEKEAVAGEDQATKRRDGWVRIRDGWKEQMVKDLVTAWRAGSDDPVSLQQQLTGLAEHLRKAWVEVLNTTQESTPETQILDALVGDLRERAAVPSTESKTREATLAQVVDAVAKDLKAAEEALAGASAVRTGANVSLQVKKDAEEQAKSSLADARAAEIREGSYETAVAILKTESAKRIEAVRSGVQLSIERTSPPPTRREIASALRKALKEKAESSEDPEKKGFTNAELLLAAQSHSELPEVRFPANPKSPTEVIDAITDTLRVARVAAQAQGDRYSVEQLASALELAEQYRSPLVYIRPPASFLRNSSPVSSLLDNRVGWRNELRTVGGRRHSAAEENRIKIQTAIDRQFWQNINRVRVTGGGKTTYALVKDDIGNWYVKGYEGDPEQVIKGVQALALSAASGGMRADLLAHAEEVARKRGAGEPIAPTRAVLGEQVEPFAERYKAATEKDAKELQATFVALPANVRDEWTRLLDGVPEGTLTKAAAEIVAEVDAAAAAPFDAIPELPAEGPEQSRFCVALLRRTADFEAGLIARLDPKVLVPAELADAEAELPRAAEQVTTLESLASTTDIDAQLALARARLSNAEDAIDRLRKSDALVRSLHRAAIEIVGGAGRRFVDRRSDALDDYRTALEVLGRRTDG